MNRTLGSILLAAAGIMTPKVASAQACIGVPSADGQFTLIGAAGFAEDAKSFGGNVALNMVGPVSLGAGYAVVTLDDVDTNANSFAGNIAFELSVPGASICPVAGAEYTRWSEEFGATDIDISSTVVPVGLGVGRSFVSGNDFAVTLFAVPQFLYVRAKVEGTEGGVSVSFSDSTNEFGTLFGARFGTQAFYAGGGVRLTTIEDSDPVFSLTFGVNLGGR